MGLILFTCLNLKRRCPNETPIFPGRGAVREDEGFPGTWPDLWVWNGEEWNKKEEIK